MLKQAFKYGYHRSTITAEELWTAIMTNSFIKPPMITIASMTSYMLPSLLTMLRDVGHGLLTGHMSLLNCINGQGNI